MEYIFLIYFLGIFHGFSAQELPKSSISCPQVKIGCTFNGEQYVDGAEKEFGCFGFRCTKNTWQYMYNNFNCSKCEITQDPHFYTFDKYAYDFQGRCNYSISQPIGKCEISIFNPPTGIISGFKYSNLNPPYGIFGDFKDCYPGSKGSCLDKTTYKLSNSLFVEIVHSYPMKLKINGNVIALTSSPVVYCSGVSSTIVGEQYGCPYVVGPYYTIIACNRNMIIYTVESHLYGISGLCGYYTGSIKDEFLTRDCSILPVSQADANNFGDNWKTKDQIDSGCLKKEVDEIKLEECYYEEKAREICGNAIFEASRYCSNGYTKEDLSRILENCVKDCCYSGTIDNCEEWAKAGSEVLCILNELSSNAKNGTEGIKGR